MTKVCVYICRDVYYTCVCVYLICVCVYIPRVKEPAVLAICIWGMGG